MIAYLVLVHRYPAQFKRMFKSIYDPANHYLIHIDKNSGPKLESDIRRSVHLSVPVTQAAFLAS